MNYGQTDTEGPPIVVWDHMVLLHGADLDRPDAVIDLTAAGNHSEPTNSPSTSID
jgi:hypothetical protein